MFVIPVALATPLVYALAGGDGGHVLMPTLAIAVLTLALGGLTAFMAKRILEPAERLDRRGSCSKTPTPALAPSPCATR